MQRRTTGQRTAGVLSIIGGAAWALVALLLVGVLGMVTSADPSVQSALGTARLIAWAMLAFGVVVIVMGSMFCRGKYQPVIAILLIAAQVLLVVLNIWSGSAADTAMAGGTEEAGSGWFGYVFSALIVIFCVLHLVQGRERYGLNKVTPVD